MGVSYQWSGGNTPTTAPNTFTQPGTYTVTVTGANGCTATSSITLTQDVVLPVVTITNNSNTTLLNCIQTSIAVTAGTGVSYQWSNAVNTATNTFTQPGTYTVTVMGANGCTSSSSILITQDIAAPVVTINNMSNTTELTCLQPTIDLQASGGVSYIWSGGSSLNTATTTISSPAVYLVLVTGANGCTSTGSITITQDIAPPVVNIINNSNTSTLTCVQTSISVTAGTGVSYQWSGGNTPATAANTFTQPGTYMVTVTGANGCTSTSMILIDEDVLPPNANIVNTTGSSMLTCTQTVIELVAAGGVSYAWSGGNTPSTPINTFAQPGTYTVTVTGANGCTITSSSLIDQDVNLPQVFFGTDITQGCIGSCVSFTDNSTSQVTTIVSWSWTLNGQEFSTLQNPVYCFTQSGIYSVGLTVTTDAGCSSTQVSNNMITIQADPVASFVLQDDMVPVSSGEALVVNQSTGAVSYVWDFGDGNQSTDTNPEHQYEDTGSYCIDLVAISSFGCLDTVEQCMLVYPDYQVYIPNAFTPNNDKVNDRFTLSGVGIKTASMEVFDRWGNTLHYEEVLTQGWSGKDAVTGEFLMQGVYVYKFVVYGFENDKHEYIGQVTLVR
jgi:gliding motility-associated-like protein